jgi:hypothetical protein
MGRNICLIRCYERSTKQRCVGTSAGFTLMYLCYVTYLEKTYNIRYVEKHLKKLFYFSWFTVDLISPAIIQSRLCRLHNLGKSSSYRVGKFPSVENRAFQPY